MGNNIGILRPLRTLLRTMPIPYELFCDIGDVVWQEKHREKFGYIRTIHQFCTQFGTKHVNQ